MNISQALNRFRWRLGLEGGKPSFNVKQGDIDAINAIEGYVKKVHEKQFDASQLFAKLYIYMVLKIMEQKKTTVYDNVARKQMGNILKMPVSQLIEMLTDSMNDSELYGLIEDAGVVVKHPALRTEEENQKNREAIKGITPEQIQEKPWKFDDVQEAIIAEINLMIELHG